ncbi:MAG: hypothetical protein MUP21_14720, partial [Dehalococcoidia bacterium]|nr:hypothetical protein [Dehalococcoidia bacterium]
MEGNNILKFINISLFKQSVISLLKGKTRKRRKQRNHILIALAVGALFTLIFISVQPFASIQWWLSDQLFLPTSPSPNVTIVSIDNESLAR